jgi:hypothetical protein
LDSFLEIPAGVPEAAVWGCLEGEMAEIVGSFPVVPAKEQLGTDNAACQFLAWNVTRPVLCASN